ncbi:MAG: DUF4270 domain-containing protein [Chitinophagales bacterium]|nr:DUF4270 domain-containing protein [Chitinophagales bacterium]
MIYRKLGGYFLLAALALGSCKKSTEIGIGILPASSDINAIFTDTFKIVTTSLKQDSLVTSNQFYSLLGNMYDPVFGKSYAAIFTEFLLPTTAIDLGDPDTLFLDSVVLTMAYFKTYGYEDVPQSFSVYEVLEKMSPEPEDGYYSNRSFATSSELLGRKQLLVPNLTDTINVLGSSFPPHMRIRLSDRFGQDLLNQSGEATLATDSAFKEYFKGLLIAPDTLATPYAANIIYLAMLSGTSGLRLYWHTPTKTGLNLSFPITTDESRTNYFKHTYTGSLVADHLMSETGDGDSLLFVQSMAGIRTRVTIPNLLNLKNVIINKAELVISQRLDANRADSIFTPPVQLLIVTLDSAGKVKSIPDNDDFNEAFPSYGGNRLQYGILPGDTVAQYKFNISQQVQLLIDGNITDYGLFLINNSAQETADRLMAGGGNRSDAYQVKLNIIYTPIE